MRAAPVAIVDIIEVLRDFELRSVRIAEKALVSGCHVASHAGLLVDELQEDVPRRVDHGQARGRIGIASVHLLHLKDRRADNRDEQEERHGKASSDLRSDSKAHVAPETRKGRIPGAGVGPFQRSGPLRGRKRP